MSLQQQAALPSRSMPLDDLERRYAAGLFSQEVTRLNKERSKTWNRVMTDLRRRGLIEGPPAGFVLRDMIDVQTDHAAAMLRARISSLWRAYEEAGKLNAEAINEIIAALQAYFQTVRQSTTARAADIARSRYRDRPLPAGLVEAFEADARNYLDHVHDELLLELQTERDQLAIRSRQTSASGAVERSPKLEAWRRAEIASYALLAVGGTARE